MPIYLFRCRECGVLEVDLPMSTPDLSNHICDCGQVAKRVFTVPSAMLYGGSGDRVRIAPEDESAFMRKKALDERTQIDYDLTGYEWVPGKGIPERFQPNIKPK